MMTTTSIRGIGEPGTAMTTGPAATTTSVLLRAGAGPVDSRSCSRSDERRRRDDADDGGSDDDADGEEEDDDER